VQEGNDGPAVVMACIDGTPTSMRAGAYAAGIARRQKAECVVVFVDNMAGAAALSAAAGFVLPDEDGMARSLREQLEAAAARLDMKVRMRVERGDPYTEIVRVADEERADVVVVGASTHAGHRLVGSLAVRLVRAGKWPVTVVP
jgi:nucleotide-binding universal stress UspA family protein